MSSSSWECAPGPFVCGSSHHSEIEYLSSVSAPSARKRLEMRPIGYDRPPPGGRNTPCLTMGGGCASRWRSALKKGWALLGRRAGAGGRVVAAVHLDHDSLVGRGLRPYLLRKDSGLVRHPGGTRPRAHSRWVPYPIPDCPAAGAGGFRGTVDSRSRGETTVCLRR